MWPFKRKTSTNPKPQPQFVTDPTPDSPIGFGYKTTWWSFLSRDTQAVADAIGLVNPQPCNWHSGIPASYENGIFISPPVGNWTLVTGFKLPPSGEQMETECLASLLKLSSQFNEVQFFSTHRVVEYHVWARAVEGKLNRGFGYIGESGEFFWNVGDNGTEAKLGWQFPTQDELDSDSGELETDDWDWPGEEHVMEIAAEWSVSPVELESEKSPGVGLIGFDAKLLNNAV